MGLGLAPLTEEQTIEHVLDALDRGDGGWLCPVNLDVLRQTVEDPALNRLVAQADLAVADGMPLVWASRLQGQPLPARVAGSTLVRTLSERAAARDRSVYLLGGNQGVAAEAAVRLRTDYPGLRIAGHRCPPFGFERDAREREAIAGDLRRTNPDIVFVGLGFPKQDKLIVDLRSVLPGAWFVSCGISFSFVTGEIQRAPVLVQRLGLEWVSRMIQEPRRLGRRYLVDGLPFAARLALSSLRLRSR
ncbi:WecB/TagA/CpsF family glycosyltransferase [Baekduia soli]|uniref:WecB/TagA/CpsF family glycosyltransferase n=2 Tax=Baekduia soli TaxID=496014 RepID=A0A5B8U0V7_9ACTN|nr:WecB/TagA/CpsF family glycosyltransferase [Baekduia soli]